MPFSLSEYFNKETSPEQQEMIKKLKNPPDPAYDFGGYITDKTGSPSLGYGANVLASLGLGPPGAGGMGQASSGIVRGAKPLFEIADHSIEIGGSKISPISGSIEEMAHDWVKSAVDTNVGNPFEHAKKLAKSFFESYKAGKDSGLYSQIEKQINDWISKGAKIIRGGDETEALKNAGFVGRE